MRRIRNRTIFGHAILAAAILFLATAALAQAPPPPVISPEVHTDRSVTFRFRAPNDQEVAVSIEGMAKSLPMQKDDQGVWTVTTHPLPPDYYPYPITPHT